MSPRVPGFTACWPQWRAATERPWNSPLFMAAMPGMRCLRDRNQMVEEHFRGPGPGEIEGIGAAARPRNRQRPGDGLSEIVIERAAHPFDNHIDRPLHGIGSNRNAAGHRLEHDQPESVDAARKDEDVRAGNVARQVSAEAVTEEPHRGIALAELVAIGPVADHHLAAAAGEL